MSFSELFYFRVILFNFFLKFNFKKKLNMVILLHSFVPEKTIDCISKFSQENLYENLERVSELINFFSPFFLKKKLKGSRLCFKDKYYVPNLWNLKYIFIFLDNFLLNYLAEIKSKDLYLKIKLLYSGHLFIGFRDFYEFIYFNSYYDYYDWGIYIKYLIKVPFFFKNLSKKKNIIITKTISSIFFSEYKINVFF